jgi:hypothetical protein
MLLLPNACCCCGASLERLRFCAATPPAAAAAAGAAAMLLRFPRPFFACKTDQHNFWLTWFVSGCFANANKHMQQHMTAPSTDDK